MSASNNKKELSVLNKLLDAVEFQRRIDLMSNRELAQALLNDVWAPLVSTEWDSLLISEAISRLLQDPERKGESDES